MGALHYVVVAVAVYVVVISTSLLYPHLGIINALHVSEPFIYLKIQYAAPSPRLDSPLTCHVDPCYKLSPLKQFLRRLHCR
jgi:hypothetical protein